MGGDGLVPYLVVLLVSVSYSWQYIYLRWVSFQMGASVIKSLKLGVYTTYTKIHYNFLFCKKLFECCDHVFFFFIFFLIISFLVYNTSSAAIGINRPELTNKWLTNMLCNKLSQTSRLKIYYIYYLSIPRLGVWHSLSVSSAHVCQGSNQCCRLGSIHSFLEPWIFSQAHRDVGVIQFFVAVRPKFLFSSDL